MEESAGKDLQVKTSGAANAAALSQSDDIVIADLSSTLTEDRSTGQLNETSFEKLGTFELDADKALDMHTSEEMPTLLETPEPEKPGKNVKFNLRKSLAWDSAFFTSDGVLDAEELSTMIGGGEKGVKHQLPGIEEEVYRSMESISTLDSDNLSLECLEAELFEDIRASIQKSSRTSNLNNSSIKVSSAKRDSQAKVRSCVLDAQELSTMTGGGEKGVKHQLPGIEEEVYRSMESISTLESDNLSLECLEADLFEDIRASIQKSSRTSNLNNSSIKVPSAKRDSQAKIRSSSKKMDSDSGKQCVQMKPVARIKDNTSSIPQPKIVNRVNSTSILTKRASLSSNQANKVQDIGKQAHATLKGTRPAKTTTQTSNITGVTGPRRGVPKPSLSSKSSLGSSTAPKMEEPTRPSSSCSNSSSSSGNDVKSSASFLRRKVDSKTSKLTAGSIPRTPSKIGMKNKATPVNPRLSSNFSNLPSNISPASSISEWSSESSSTTSTINRKSASRGSIDTGASHKSFDGDAIESALTIHPTSRNSNQNGNQAIILPTAQTASLSRPPVVQPTGLRMPSPKIGFFDGGKSGVRTPNGSMQLQSRLPTAVPRTGATHSSPATSDAAKFGKLPPSKTTAAHTSMKPNPQKTAPKPFQEQPSIKQKISTSSPGVKSSLVTRDHKDEISTQESEEFKIASAEDSAIDPSLNICINSSHIVENDSNKQSHSGNKSLIKEETHENGQVEIPNMNRASEACSNEGFIAVKGNKVDKTMTDDSRTPLALRNSVCDTIETGMEVHENSVNILFVESQHKENNEVI